MPILYDTRWFGSHGIGRFAREVFARLSNLVEFHGTIRPSSPLDSVYLSYRLIGDGRKAGFFYSPGYNAPLYSRIPYAFTIHDLIHIDMAKFRSDPRLFYYEHFVKPACKRAHAVFTVSDFSKSRILEWSGLDPSRVINVGNGINFEFSREGDSLRWNRPYLFCVGNRKPHKNESRSLEAFASIARRIPHDLLFSGNASESLIRKGAALGVESRIRFIGVVSDSELASVYRGADAVLFVSLQEGFGLPVVEAMACGTPVITSNLSSLPEIAGGAAVLVDPYSVDHIAAALENVLADDRLRGSLTDRGLINAQRFSWKRTAEAVEVAIEARY